MYHLLEKQLGRVRRPSRYLGKELFAVVKDPGQVKLHFALAFPDLYEVGMSYPGLKILYHLLNSRPEVWAERVFAPAPDLVRVLTERDLPLPSLESGRPLNAFDVVGFSLSYELGYSNVLAMLSLGKIPLRSGDRRGEDPLIIAGGPCTFNPEPVAEFFDALVIGDGEEVAGEICDRWLRWKEAGSPRSALLSSLAELPGVYVPSFRDGNRDGGPKPIVAKRIVPDLDQVPFPATSPLPYQQIIHDRLSVEIARGCTRGCRFCQAGIIYRPVRERSPQQVYRILEEGLTQSGYAEATLLSLSSGDYTCLNDLLPALMERWEREKVAFSLPSLRVDTLSPEVMEQILRVRKTGFTIAPEAGTQRLRDVINKNVTEDDILQTARRVFSLGWRVLKLYFMIGLPSERQEDLEGLVTLVKKIRQEVRKRGGRPDIHVALSLFIPKPHTPFQWAGLIPLEESRRRLNYLRSALNGGHIQVKWNDTRQSFLEALLSRGGREMGRVLFRAHQKGAYLDAWGEHFSWEIWRMALEEEGIDPQEILRERDLPHPFPWDFIRTGVDKTYLFSEYQKALAGQTTPDCRQGECGGCGVCPTYQVTPLLHRGFKKPEGFRRVYYPPEAVKKFRFLLTKCGPSRFLGHLEWKEAVIRALRRAKLPLAYSQGFHPQPRISFGPALPVGLSSEEETVDVQLSDWLQTEQVKKMLPPELFPGTRLLHVFEVPLHTPLPREKVHQYRVVLDLARLDRRRFQEFLESDHWWLERAGHKNGPLDLKKMLRRFTLTEGPNGKGTAAWIQDTLPEGDIRPEKVLQAAFNLSEGEILELEVIKSPGVFP